MSTDRGLSAAVLAELAKQNITLAHLLEVGFDSPDYFTDGRRDILWDGKLFIGSGDWIKIPEIKETIAPSLASITLTVSGVNQANIQTALTEDYTNASVSVHRLLLDADYQMIDQPVEIFFGVMDNFTATEDPTSGTSEVVWKATSHWADFERVAGRRTNNEDQLSWFPGDVGMEFSPRSIAELKWGSK